MAITGAAWVKNEHSGEFFVAFYCGGKIIVSKVQQGSGAQGVLLEPMVFVGGSTDFSKNDPVSAAMQALKIANHLIVEVDGPTEADVPMQKPAIFIQQHPPYQGYVYVYYYNSKNEVVMREITPWGKVSAAMTVD